ncbi:CopG family antitoxin [Thiococcus pfennigii]|uniref:CopG family antitoxin n=1 Tax=Thiococcus pfennigii TaxID=1057 RepID=UPI001A9266BD|nr:CopG family antitoxin [Thiococcus pfennigii]
MSHLPATDSISELAAFWQAHDLTDFEDELIEVSEPEFQRTENVSVQLAAEDISALRTRARREHISEADLVSRWVHERLRGKEKSPTSR